MKFSCVPSQLRAFVALPAAGAEDTLRAIRVLDCKTLSVYLLYQDSGAGTGAPTLFPRWQFRATAWDPSGGQAQGVMLVGGSLARESYPFVGPAAAGFWVRVVEILVPAGAETFAGSIAETGNAGAPGNCAVMGVASL